MAWSDEERGDGRGDRRLSFTKQSRDPLLGFSEVNACRDHHSSSPFMETEAIITQLGEVLAQLESRPQNVGLVRQQIELLDKLEMFAEMLLAIASLSKLIMLDTSKESKAKLIDRNMAPLL